MAQSKAEKFEDRLSVVKSKLLSKVFVHIDNNTNEIPFLILIKNNLHYCDNWHRQLLSDRKTKLKNGSEIITPKAWSNELAVEDDDF